LTWNGQIYSASGVYTYLTTNSNGCDSTATLSLTINYSITITDSLTICKEDSVVVGVNIYTLSGDYTDTLSTTNGCDSIINTVIDVIDVNINQNDTAICLGDSVVLEVESIIPQFLDLVVSSGQTIYTDDIRTSVVLNNLSGTNIIHVSDISGFSIGDKVLIITMQDNLSYGSYEFNRIISLAPSNAIILESTLQNSYVASSGVNHQVLKVQEYNSVIVDGILSCHAWNGNTGGVLCFDAYSDIVVNSSGSINSDEKGYRGGDNVSG